jgi:hypothetical protein
MALSSTFRPQDHFFSPIGFVLVMVSGELAIDTRYLANAAFTCQVVSHECYLGVTVLLRDSCSSTSVAPVQANSRRTPVLLLKRFGDEDEDDSECPIVIF